MAIENFKNCKNYCVTSGIIILALAAVWIGADVANKIKEGRYIGQEFETKNTISVSGSGEVFAKPDLAFSIFSVITEAKTVSSALTENTKKMNAVINLVKDQGVAEKDLKTAAFNIFPRYEFQKVETEIYPYPPGKRVLVGYEVSQSLEVKIRDMGKIGAIIEGVAGAGANQIGDLSFLVEREDDLKNQARKQAIDEAKTKAKELASQLGVKLVRIINFNENGNFPIFFRGDVAAEGKGGGGTPQIETGENKISVQVTITYEIR